MDSAKPLKLHTSLEVETGTIQFSSAQGISVLQFLIFRENSSGINKYFLIESIPSNSGSGGGRGRRKRARCASASR